MTYDLACIGMLQIGDVLIDIMLAVEPDGV